MKHVGSMTIDEMREMQNAAQCAMVQFAKKKNLSGLSHNGWFDFYSAVQAAIEAEWKKAKKK